MASFGLTAVTSDATSNVDKDNDTQMPSTDNAGTTTIPFSPIETAPAPPTASSAIDMDTIEPSTPWTAAADGDLVLLQAALTKLNTTLLTPDPNGFTVLHSAAAYNQMDVLKWILPQLPQTGGDDINVADTDGDTPLHHCDAVEAAKLLVETGKADIRRTNKDGKTPRQLKEEECVVCEDEDDSDDEDQVELKALVEYLKSLEIQ